AGETVASYDAVGNPPTTFAYDLAGREILVTDPDGNKTQAVFDPADNAVKTVDANGNATIKVFDGLGRETASTPPLGAGSAWVYDPAGNVRSQTIAGITTQVLY